MSSFLGHLVVDGIGEAFDAADEVDHLEDMIPSAIFLEIPQGRKDRAGRALLALAPRIQRRAIAVDREDEVILNEEKEISRTQARFVSITINERHCSSMQARCLTEDAIIDRLHCQSMFELLSKKGKARRGRLTTPHGVIETPIFMPIATKGAVKTLSPKDVEDLGAHIILNNTYHFLLRPGKEAIEKLGGSHKLMGWDKPILTDSGGYQVFSLSKINDLSEDGVTFQSHIDGARIHLTPESSMEMQKAIGADIVMQFDDVAAGQSTKERFKDAMERSLRWAKRCREAMKPNERQALFGIVQGGIHEDLRKESIDGLTEIGFEGYAIGGLSVGEPREDMYRVTAFCCDNLPEDRPRYFMGGGMPEEIVRNVNAGVDMFDCVIPTRNARHGSLFVWAQDPKSVDWSKNPEDFYEKYSAAAEKYQFDYGKIDEHCDCETCATTTRAYLRHLFATNEMLALRLATIHNVRFFLRMMEEIRSSLE